MKKHWKRLNNWQKSSVVFGTAFAVMIAWVGWARFVAWLSDL